jgi:predicted nucleic acid-binding protein
MPQTKLVYWDSCIFIAWLKDENRPNGEMAGVYECVQHVEARRARLITSVMTRTEVFEAELSVETRERYAQLLKRRNVQMLDQDLRVSNLAREVREYYRQRGLEDGLPGLTAADAVHLATAIHYKADAFYTFDDGKKGGRSLLSLNGNVAGHPLLICKPEFTQYRLI